MPMNCPFGGMRARDPLFRRCRTVVRCSLLPGEIARKRLIAGHGIQPCWCRFWVSQTAPGCRWVMSRTTQVYGVSSVLRHAIWPGRLSCPRPYSWTTSLAFHSISPGLVHRSVHSFGAASGHLLGRAPCGLPRVLRDGKGCPWGPIEVSPCRPGGSGVRALPSGRGDDPARIPISEGGPGCGAAPREKGDGFTSDHDRCDCRTAVHLGKHDRLDSGLRVRPTYPAPTPVDAAPGRRCATLRTCAR
jgi:hypothetical protein